MLCDRPRSPTEWTLGGSQSLAFSSSHGYDAINLTIPHSFSIVSPVGARKPWDLDAKAWDAGARVWDSGAKTWDAGAVRSTAETGCRSLEKFKESLRSREKRMIFVKGRA